MTALRRCAVVGGGGHGSVVMDAIQSNPACILAGYLDRAPTAQGQQLNATWLGGDEALAGLLGGLDGVVLGVGAVRATGVRAALVARLEGLGARWVEVVHPAACVAGSAQVHAGAVVCARAVLQPGAVAGVHSIINTGAIVEHHVEVGAFVVVSPGAILGGGCVIGAGAFLGLGAVVRDHVRVGAGATVGMGAVVTADVPPGATVMGCPARQRGA